MTVTATSDHLDRLPLWELDALSRIFAMSSCAESRSEVAGDDAREIAAALGGDGEAFGRLVAKYQTTIGRQMQRFSRDQTVIEELVHEVFVEAYVSLKSYRSRSPLIHWLRKIAVRVGYRYWKRQARERETTVLWSQTDDGLQRVARGLMTDASEASEVLGDLLDVLPPRDRLVLTLLYWDGCTVAEAAELTGWSRAMVKVQAYRARNRLRQWIEEWNR